MYILVKQGDHPFVTLSYRADLAAASLGVKYHVTRGHVVVKAISQRRFVSFRISSVVSVYGSDFHVRGSHRVRMRLDIEMSCVCYMNSDLTATKTPRR